MNGSPSSQATAEETHAKALIAELRRRLALPVWAELESGCSIRMGERVRSNMCEYDCILSHTKAAWRQPGNPVYWRPVPYDAYLSYQEA